MSQQTKWTLAVLVLFVYVACSPKRFSAGDNCQGSDQSCVTQNGRNNYNVTEVVAGGKLDLLVVVDNSASMSTEQKQLANRFNGFIQNLENKKVDYRLAVTTTDIASLDNSPRTINANGLLQDGKLIAFSGGAKYITNNFGSIVQKDAAFKAAIVRQETISCEQFILGWTGSKETQSYTSAYQVNCPSGDERGIFAAHLAIKNNSDAFVRPEADLAIIFLSDEDVRSQLYYYGNQNFLLADNDKANSLLNLVKSLYPQKYFSTHAIITKDSTCLTQQNAQTGGAVSGSYGLEYANMAQLTSGVVGDICASDYNSQLLGIYNNITTQIVDRFSLKCANPADLVVSLTNNSDPTISWVVNDSVIKFNKKLPVGVQVSMQYSCNAIQ
jgi:hypothetical protein